MGKCVFFFLLFFQLSAFGAEYDTLYIEYGDSVNDFFVSAVHKAMSQGMLTTELKKKQPASLKYKNKVFAARIRMKGDWLDHVRNDRWSLRVNLKEGNVYAARKFSLQFPETRGGDNERIFHEELRKRDILTPHYTYVHLVVNDAYWGVFAFEEHFDEGLLERSARSNGPILKFDEDGFWECQQLTAELGDDVCVEYPIFAAAKIRPFGKKKTYSDTVQFMRFNNGRQILDAWRKGAIHPDKLDLERFAKYYALCDVFGFYHGLQWHNQRFYYRVSDGRLEPVAYDCYSEDNSLIGKDFLGRFDEHYSTVYFHEQWFNYQLFTLQEFVELYKAELQKYIDAKAWEIEGVPFDMHERLKSRAQKIEEFLKEEQALPSYYPYAEWKLDNPDLVKKYDVEFPKKPLSDVELVAESSGDRLEITNYHIRPISIIGYSTDSGFVLLDKAVQIGAGKMVLMNWESPKRMVAVTEYGDSVKCKVVDITSTIQLNEKTADWKNYFEKQGSDWYWNSSIKELNARIELPEGNNYFIDSTDITFGEKGLLVCNGNLTIRSCYLGADQIGNTGIRMFGKNLEMSMVTIHGFRISPNDGNSPIQVYGTTVIMDNVHVSNIEAEDALNFVNCHVQIAMVFITLCSGDGLDMDFCTGYATVDANSCKGDGVDLSFGNFEIIGGVVTNCGDKGISIGEQTLVKKVSVGIAFTPFGIAVKDASSASIVDTKFKDCGTDITAFRKKPKFVSGGEVILKNTPTSKVSKDQYSIIHVE